MNDYNFEYYLVDNDMQLVYGFNDKSEANLYGTLLDMRVVDHSKIVQFNINPNDVNNWSDDVPPMLENLENEGI